MIQFFASKFIDDLDMVEHEMTRHSLHYPENTVFTQEQKTRLAALLERIEQHCIEHELEKTRARCSELRGQLEYVPSAAFTEFDKAAIEPKTDHIFKSCGSIKLYLQNELGERKFAFIPTAQSKYFECDNLFGLEVSKAFPSAMPDIKDAGNCLAADLTTAAVFHLMRVAEFGLRALAKELGCAFSFPIEFATWGNIIDKLDEKLKALKPTARGDKREDDYQFYSRLVQEARSFQHAWRDPVMHVRTRFDEPMEAENVFNHVRRFMQTLAMRVAE